jgi:hypothetical protein
VTISYSLTKEASGIFYIVKHTYIFLESASVISGYSRMDIVDPHCQELASPGYMNFTISLYDPHPGGYDLLL